MKWPGGKSDAEARRAEGRPRTIVDSEGGSEVGRPEGSAGAGVGPGGVSKEARAASRDGWLDRASTSILSSRPAAGGGGRGCKVGEERVAMIHSRLVIAACTSAMGVSAPRPNLRATGWGMAGGAMEPRGEVSWQELGSGRLVPGGVMRAAGVAWCAALGLGVMCRDFSSDQLLMSQSENWSDMDTLVHGGRDTW
jgi:hypothetical protein